MLSVIPRDDDVRAAVLRGGVESAEGLEARRAANATAIARLRGGGGGGAAAGAGAEQPKPAG